MAEGLLSMTLETYMKLYEKAETSRGLYRSWEVLRKTLAELLELDEFSAKLHECLAVITDYCKTLGEEMKEAEKAISTDEARAFRRDYATEVSEWRHEVSREDYDPVDDTPFIPAECVYYAPEEPIDYVSLGMGL